MAASRCCYGTDLPGLGVFPNRFCCTKFFDGSAAGQLLGYALKNALAGRISIADHLHGVFMGGRNLVRVVLSALCEPAIRG